MSDIEMKPPDETRRIWYYDEDNQRKWSYVPDADGVTFTNINACILNPDRWLLTGWKDEEPLVWVSHDRGRVWERIV